MYLLLEYGLKAYIYIYHLFTPATRNRCKEAAIIFCSATKRRYFADRAMADNRHYEVNIELFMTILAFREWCD
jgi:hypothetical protein